MSRTQVAIFVCAIQAVIGILVDGGMRPMAFMAVFVCAPLLLHYLTNRPNKGEQP